ncbi:DUF599 domain-containing protein [Lichenibacterium dinghuense]|uniref:DUF599 domain-containing protein n=1 Tax=Lichenibacterium dinghuense TaxID=2895977 RepID=UPI001F3E9CD5|nr:DUF599 domain-containing protein [Lichenibacterium sp. 6Y81]
MLLSPLDYAAVGFFLFGWFAYHVLVERSPFGRQALNNRMNEYRLRWMLEMQARENRIVDSSLMSTLQSGTSFFASTSLLALGGSLTLLRGADDALRILNDFPLGTATARSLWDLKVVGLVVIFGYAFFKFAWCYRLFNYASILIGATPSHKSGRPDQRRLTALRAAEMNIVAGKHFNRGQRAFFFALAYLGWFVGPAALIVTTAVVVFAIIVRQFASDALRAASLELPPDDADQGAGNTSAILPEAR